MIGYGAVWQPRSAVKDRNTSLRKILSYCVARKIDVYVTYKKDLIIPEKYRSKIKLVKLIRRGKSTVNKIIGWVFDAHRNKIKTET